MKIPLDPRERPDGARVPARRHPWAPTPVEAAAFFLAALFLLLSWGVRLDLWTRPPARLPRADLLHRIDPRTAGEGELMLLPGIGSRRALRIVEARERAGPGAGAREILSRSGLSPGVLEGMAPWLAGLE